MAPTTIKTCSKCGTDKTYMQNNHEKWYYDKHTKERVCKNCYSKNRTKPIIDLTKVKPYQIKIDNSFATTTTTADDTTDKILIDKKPVSIPRSDSVLLDKKKKQRKNYDDMSLEERSAMRKFTYLIKTMMKDQILFYVRYVWNDLTNSVQHLR